MKWIAALVIFLILIVAWFVWEFFTAETEPETHENDDDMDQGAALGMGGAA
jgi:hypothetical protein